MIQSNNTPPQLTMCVIPQTELDFLKSEVKEIKSLLQKKDKEETYKLYVSSSEAQKMLHVSKKTWQTYRDKKVIPFAQFGRKIYVKRADIEDFLNNHYIQK